MYSCTLSLTSAIDGAGGQCHAPGRFTPRKDPLPVVQEACWVRSGAENLAATGIPPPDHLAQWWANYGPRARCGPLRGSIRPAADFKI